MSDRSDQPARPPAPPSTGPRARRGSTPTPWLDRASPVDLRKALDAEAAERIALRASWLAPADRSLVLAVVRDGHSLAGLARATGRDQRALRRRFARSVSRLLDERTAVVARALPTMGRARAGVARVFYLEGRTLREAADELGLGLHTVRAHRQAIEGVIEAARRADAPDRRWRHAEGAPR